MSLKEYIEKNREGKYYVLHDDTEVELIDVFLRDISEDEEGSVRLLDMEDLWEMTVPLKGDGMVERTPALEEPDDVILIDRIPSINKGGQKSFVFSPDKLLLVYRCLRGVEEC